jgi:hypothetical protein
MRVGLQSRRLTCIVQQRLEKKLYGHFEQLKRLSANSIGVKAV